MTLADINRLEIRAQRSLAHGGVILYLGMHGKPVQVQEIFISELNPAASAPISAVLREEEAQTLMDDLWRDGYRPSRGPVEPTAMTEQYIGDLRRWCDRMLDTLLTRGTESKS